MRTSTQGVSVWVGSGSDMSNRSTTVDSFVQVALAIAVVPLSLWVLGHYSARPLQMPPAAIAKIVVMMTLLPLVTGVIVRTIAPALAVRLEKPTKLIAMVLLGAGLGAASNRGIERPKAVVAMGLERPHPQLLGQGEGLTVVRFGQIAFRRLILHRNLAEEA